MTPETLDLSLVPLDVLLEEIKRRFDSCVFLGDQIHERTEEDVRGAYTLIRKGAAHNVVGLLHLALLATEDQARDELAEPDE